MAFAGVREGLAMDVREMERFLEQWQMDARDLRRRMILSPTPRERERWYAMLLLAQGWSASATAEALERDPHTIGRWAAAFGEGGPTALMFEQTEGSPPPALREAQQADLKAAVQEPPAESNIELANWTLRQAQEEGGPSFCLGALRYQPEPQHLSELSPPSGIRAEASQETSAQGE